MKIKKLCLDRVCNLKDCSNCKIDDYVYRIENETNIIKSIYEFMKLTKEDFNQEPQPIILKTTQTRFLIDFCKSIDNNLDVQCWRQYSLWLTYNHIYCNYELIDFICKTYLNKLMIRKG